MSTFEPWQTRVGTERLTLPDEIPPIRDASTFASEPDGNPEIYVMNADGSGQRNLTRSPADEFWFAWSPVRKT